MECEDVLARLRALGDERTARALQRQGAPGHCWGVKVGDMKKLLRECRGRHDLALELFATGQPDAQYFAGLLAEPARMTREDLQRWADGAAWSQVSEYSVAGVAAAHPDGWTLGLAWIDAQEDAVSSAGWSTLASVVSVAPDDELDLEAIGQLLERVGRGIAAAPNRTRYAMNQFVIGVGCFVEPLHAAARETAARIGKVEVDMNGTACKVPDAVATIDKVARMERVGRKRPRTRC